MELGTGPWTANLNDGTQGMQLQFSANPEQDQWVHLAVVVDREGGTFTAFLDGVEQDSSTLGTLGTLTSAQPLMIGGNFDQYFRGRIDEVRLAAVKWPAAYLLASYHQAVSQSQYVSIGSQQVMPPPIP